MALVSLMSLFDTLPVEPHPDLVRQLVMAQGLLVHPDDRLFARAAVPAEPPAGGV